MPSNLRHDHPRMIEHLDPRTFLCELDPHCVEIHRMCKYELPTWRLSKVIVWLLKY